MAVVRELITLLGTEVDPKGFHQYETGIQRVKELALNAGKLIGIAFSIDKIVEFADGLVNAGKEINKIRGQLNLIARPIDDMDAAQQRVFETAQQLGVAYKDIFETFKMFSSEMRETQIPQEQILQTTKNLFEAMRVERASPEKIQEVMGIFERTFRRGAMRSVGVGQLFGLSPEIFKMLEKAFNTDEEGLRKLAKEGKITAEAITKAFGVANVELDEKFSKVPQKLGVVFTKIYNDLVNVTAQIYKIADASVFMGQIIWWVWTRFTSVIKTVVESMGGLKKVIDLVGIAIGISLIRPLLYATAITIRWAIASWTAVLPWLAMAAAVFAVAVAVEDLVGWMQGKKSVIGTWLGPFKDLKENFAKLDIFAGFRTVGDILRGDWDALKKDFGILMEDMSAKVLAFTGLVALAFVSWQVISFVKLIAKIFAVETAVKAVGAAGETLKPAFAGANSGATTLLGTLGRISLLLAAIGFLYWAVKPGKTQTQAEENKGLGRPEDAGPFFAHSTETPSADARPMSEITGGTNADRKKAFNAWMNRKFGWTGMHFGPRLATDTSLAVDPATAMLLGGDMPMPMADPVGGVQARNNWIGRNFGTAVPGIKSRNKQDWLSSGQLSAMPGIAPGAIGGISPGPTTNNTDIKPVFNQTIGSINVTTLLDADQIGQVVGDKVSQLTEFRFDAFARSLTTSSPRVEAPTQ